MDCHVGQYSLSSNLKYPDSITHVDEHTWEIIAKSVFMYIFCEYKNIGQNIQYIDTENDLVPNISIGPKKSVSVRLHNCLMLMKIKKKTLKAISLSLNCHQNAIFSRTTVKYILDSQFKIRQDK